VTRHLLLVSGLAVLGAVINHSLGWGFTALFWWTDRYAAVGALPDFSQLGGASYYALRVLEQLVVASVPAFLFVSGVFVAVAAGRAQSLAWSRVTGRIRMLVVPYLVWSVAILALRAAEGTIDTPGGYTRQILFGRAAPPYYFIPLLVQLYLLAPWLVRGLRARPGLVLGAAALVQSAVLATQYPVLLGVRAPLASWVWRHAPGWFFPLMGLWFVLGIYAGLHGPAFRERLARWRPVLPWAALALGVAGLVEWEVLLRFSRYPWLDSSPTLVDSAFSAALILTVLAMADARWPLSDRFEALGSRSYGVYLVHAPVLEIAARGIYHVAPVVLAHQVLFLPALVAIGLAVPLILMATVNRSAARPVYNYLFG
jgi:fucose 4-O-acetylase-like acetyltransferase